MDTHLSILLEDHGHVLGSISLIAVAYKYRLRCVCKYITHTHTHTHTGLKGRAREARGDARVRGTHDAQDARNTNLDAHVRGMQGNINLDARLRGTQDACNTRVCTGASVSRVSRGATRTRSLACTESSKELFEEV